MYPLSALAAKEYNPAVFCWVFAAEGIIYR